MRRGCTLEMGKVLYLVMHTFLKVEIHTHYWLISINVRRFIPDHRQLSVKVGMGETLDNLQKRACHSLR